MRIASLLPGCTEWTAAFGAADRLVGRSHACDHPPEVLDLPALTRPRSREKNLSPLQESISPFQVDLDTLAALQPEIILTQTLCRVCAVTEEQVAELLSQEVGSDSRLFSMSARTFKQVLNDALRLGQAIGCGQASMRVIADLESRLQHLRDRLGLRRTATEEERPTVAAIEWMDPLMTAGHWTPDLITLAGGRPVCASAGARSEVLSWDVLRETDPDVIALMFCGMNLSDSLRHVHRLVDLPGWSELAAVRGGRVYLFDGNAYFNRPGPRLYRSIELVAAALYGDRAGVEVDEREMRAIEL